MALTRDLPWGELEEESFGVSAGDLPEEGLKEGDQGVVVEVLGAGAAYVNELLSNEGRTVALPTLRPEDLRLVKAPE